MSFLVDRPSWIPGPWKSIGTLVRPEPGTFHDQAMIAQVFTVIRSKDDDGILSHSPGFER